MDSPPSGPCLLDSLILQRNPHVLRIHVRRVSIPVLSLRRRWGGISPLIRLSGGSGPLCGPTLLYEGVVGKPVGVRVRRTRTGEGADEQEEKRYFKSASARSRAAKADVENDEAQAVESPLRHHANSKRDFGFLP